MSLSKSLVETLAGWIVSPVGARADRFGVRLTGHSFVSWIFARAAGVEYNAPLLLTAIGRVSGRKRTVVLPHFQVGDSLCIVGSLGGAPRDPHWARNLRADPRSWIRMNRQLRPVRARLAQGPERETLWATITDFAPIYLEYAERAQAHRQIPVFVLTETQEAS